VDGDALTYAWKEGATTLATTTDPTKIVTLAFPVGVHTVTLVVTDGAGGIASDTVQISVPDVVAHAALQLAQCQADLGTASAAVEASLARVEQDLRQDFGNPALTIPGGSPAARLENLSSALVSLHRGQKMGLYRALGGR
jgi:hypothetical protein